MESQTLSSSPDDTGHRYWVSFSNSTYGKGTTSNAHKGILNGMGPRSGDKAIVKAFRDEPGTEQRCDVEISKSEKAQELACLFKRKFLENNQRIVFEKPLKALMDNVALMDALSISRRRLKEHEWVLIESNIGKRFQNFVTRNGDVRRFIEPLTAFVHFTYHHTGGELIICGLKGRADENGWTLKIPTIHSINCEYGLSDCGESGMLQVLGKHGCNYICQGMQLPNLFQRRLLSQVSPECDTGPNSSSPIPMLQRQASAPYDPEVFADPSSPMIQGYLDSPPPYLLSPLHHHQQMFFHSGMDCCPPIPETFKS